MKKYLVPCSWIIVKDDLVIEARSKKEAIEKAQKGASIPYRGTAYLPETFKVDTKSVRIIDNQEEE